MIRIETKDCEFREVVNILQTYDYYSYIYSWYMRFIEQINEKKS